MAKRILAAVLTICTLIFAAVPLAAFAESVNSGTFGENIVWEYDGETKTLTLDGTGNMFYMFTMPWSDFKSEIENIVIGDGITNISDNVFVDCAALKTVYIGKSVARISASAFRSEFEDYVSTPYAVSPIENIMVSDENEYYISLDGVLLSRDMTTLIQYPVGSPNEEYTFPSTVKTVLKKAFADCTALRSVVMDDALEVIGTKAFKGCTNLSDAAVPDFAESIQEDAFLNTALQNDESRRVNGVLYSGNWILNVKKDTVNLQIREGTVGAADKSFSTGKRWDSTALETVYIPKSMRKLDGFELSICENLKAITVDADSEWFWSQNGVLYNISVTELLVFPCKNGQTRISVPNTVEKIGNYAFRNCDTITEVILPPSVRVIGDNAFRYSDGLVKINFEDGLEEIGESAFSSCSKLNVPKIPETVTRIGWNAFAYTVTYNDEKNWKDDLLFYLDGCLLDSRSGNDVQRLEVEDGTRLIADRAIWYNFENMTELVLPNSLMYIGEDAASGNEKLERVLLYKTPEMWSEVCIGDDNWLTEGAELVFLPFTKSTALCTDSGIALSTAVYNMEKGKKIIAAGYRDNRLTDIKTVEFTGADENFWLSGAESAAVFIWDSNITPCAPKPERLMR